MSWVRPLSLPLPAPGVVVKQRATTEIELCYLLHGPPLGLESHGDSAAGDLCRLTAVILAISVSHPSVHSQCYGPFICTKWPGAFIYFVIITQLTTPSAQGFPRRSFGDVIDIIVAHCDSR